MTNHTTMQQFESGSAIELQDEMSPFIIEFFLVQGIGFTCMAYHDRDGRWHRAIDNEELPGLILVLE
jgi:hypothetical protein